MQINNGGSSSPDFSEPQTTGVILKLSKSMAELERMDIETFKKNPKTPIVLVLDNIRSALNVGSIFRTADAFACEKIILCGYTAQPPHREILKTALGATESVEWEHYDNIQVILEKLRREEYTLLAVEQATNSVKLQDLCEKISSDSKIVFILGNEVDGVSNTALFFADKIVEIPQFGTKHSLNVAVTVGIVVWEWVKNCRITDDDKDYVLPF